MKVCAIVFTLVSCTLAAEFANFGSKYDKEDLVSLNDRIMARLQEEAGSERGVYHVYLSDGRLQRVQYTTAPVTAQQVKKPANELGDVQQTFNLPQNFGSPANTYYVQVPQDRLENLRAGQEYSRIQQQEPAAAKSDAAQFYQPLEVNAQFLPLQVVTPQQLAQFRNQQ